MASFRYLTELSVLGLVMFMVGLWFVNRGK
jgi:hypothetical protein